MGGSPLPAANPAMTTPQHHRHPLAGSDRGDVDTRPLVQAIQVACSAPMARATAPQVQRGRRAWLPDSFPLLHNDLAFLPAASRLAVRPSP